MHIITTISLFTEQFKVHVQLMLSMKKVIYSRSQLPGTHGEMINTGHWLTAYVKVG